MRSLYLYIAFLYSVALVFLLASCSNPAPTRLCPDLEEVPEPTLACMYLDELCPEGTLGKNGYTCEELVVMSWPKPGENGDAHVKFGYNPTAISHSLCTLRHYSQPNTSGCDLWHLSWCGKTGKNNCVPEEPKEKTP